MKIFMLWSFLWNIVLSGELIASSTSYLLWNGDENSKNLRQGEGVDLKKSAKKTKRRWRKWKNLWGEYNFLPFIFSPLDIIATEAAFLV